MERPAPSVHARRARLAVVAAASVAVILLVAACGGTVGYTKATGDRANGKQLFAQKCAGCHTLADAGSTSQIGPNLDFAFLQSRRDGLGQSTIAQVVRGQIAYPVTNPPTAAPGMPADLVTGQAAEDVASYVAAVAGVGAGAGASAVPAPAAPSPATTAPATTAPVTTSPTTAATGPATSTTPASTGGAAASARGKQVFATAGCGGCHTLAAAGASGTVGPSLDQRKPSAALVRTRVADGKGAMPSFKDRLSDADIAAVAQYVSSVAGK